MAVRVKKLAQELAMAPEHALVALAEAGFPRFKSPDDMVSDAVAAKLRKHVAEIRKVSRRAPAPVPQPPARSAPPPARSSAASPRPAPPIDQRDRLAGALDRPIDEVAALSAADERIQATLAEATQAVRAEQAALHAQSRRLADRGAELQREADDLRVERDALQLERDALHAERRALRDELDAARAEIAARAADLDALEAGGVPLARLLDERGLRGVDEHARALAALASSRLLDPVAARLRVIDAGPVRRLLRDRIVLGSTPLDGLDGVALVLVAPDRAEIPSADALARLRERLWSECLLSGLRRVRLVGVRALELRLLRDGIDPRLEVTMLPAVHRDGAGAREDVEQSDLVVLRDVDLSASASAAYEGAPGRVVRATSPGLDGLVADVVARLAEP